MKYLLIIFFLTPYYGGSTVVEMGGKEACEIARSAVLLEHKDNDSITAICVRG